MFKLFKNLSCGARAQEPEKDQRFTSIKEENDYISNMIEYLKILKTEDGEFRKRITSGDGDVYGFTEELPFTGADKLNGYDKPVTLFVESGQEEKLDDADPQPKEVIYPGAVRLYQKSIDRLSIESANKLYFNIKKYTEETDHMTIKIL